MKIKRGDNVIVIAGNDRGKTGLIKEVNREKGRVIVEGVNLRWKHRKPSQQNPKGERVQLEVGVHASNVMLLDEKTGKGVRRRPEVEGKSATKKAAKKQSDAPAKAAATPAKAAATPKSKSKKS
jgi:large subunit ribosomal protein L24